MGYWVWGLHAHSGMVDSVPLPVRTLIILVCKLDLIVYVSATSQATSHFVGANNIPTGCIQITFPRAVVC
jgi:hypothetical protein